MGKASLSSRRLNNSLGCSNHPAHIVIELKIPAGLIYISRSAQLRATVVAVSDGSWCSGTCTAMVVIRHRSMPVWHKFISYPCSNEPVPKHQNSRKPGVKMTRAHRRGSLRRNDVQFLACFSCSTPPFHWLLVYHSKPIGSSSCSRANFAYQQQDRLALCSFRINSMLIWPSISQIQAAFSGFNFEIGLLPR